MKKSIISNNRLVYDDGAYLFYTNRVGILKEPFAELMDKTLNTVEHDFNRFKTLTFEFLYDENTSIEEYYQCILKGMGFKYDPRIPRGGWDGANTLCFLEGKQLIKVENYKLKFNTIISRYCNKQVINSLMIFWAGAGDIWNDDGLRYYIPSKEGCRHKTPHVHVEYRHEEKASIDIKNGVKLAGDMKPKILKKARERILDNQEYLLDCWNKKTDGLNVDINHYLGITSITDDPYEKYRQ